MYNLKPFQVFQTEKFLKDKELFCLEHQALAGFRH